MKKQDSRPSRGGKKKVFLFPSRKRERKEISLPGPLFREWCPRKKERAEKLANSLANPIMHKKRLCTRKDCGKLGPRRRFLPLLKKFWSRSREIESVFQKVYPALQDLFPFDFSFFLLEVKIFISEKNNGGAFCFGDNIPLLEYIALKVASPPRSNERVMNKPAMKKEIVSALAEAA